MKILHTSDWHLGKRLEGAKRIEEQRVFIDNLEKIVEGENPKLILIAGDIFDTPTPSSEAETLFFDAMKKISNRGKRAIVIIPGNHDSAERLSASKNLARDFGIIIYERAFEEKSIGKYGSFEIEKSTAGGIILNIDKERIFLYSLPYISEAQLDERCNGVFEENFSYSDKIGQVLKKGVEELNLENIPKVIMAHLFITGSIGDGDEKGVELGGSKGVELQALPEVEYIALGHIHKPIKYLDKRACYSGSPIEYRVTESKYKKKVMIVDIDKNLHTDIKEIELENYKPIKKYEVKSIDEALNLSKEKIESREWIYLKIYSQDFLTSDDIRELSKNKNIVEIKPIIMGDEKENIELKDYSELDIKESFIEYYKLCSNIEPKAEIVELFMRVLEGE